MNGKRILSLVLAVTMAAGLNSMTSMAATRKKITTVNLSVSADVVPGGSVFDQQAELTVKNGKIDVGEYEFTNSGFQWYEHDVPRLEVKLYAQEGYYFSVSESGFTISGGTFVKQAREDFSQTLTLTIDLPRVGEFTQDITSAEWGSKTMAVWSPAAGAGSYEVKLYRDGKHTGGVKTSVGTSLDLSGSMGKVGNYTFKVRPVSKQNSENKGDWVESSANYVDAAAAEQNRTSSGNSGGWKQDGTGWWYANNDGTYPAEIWQSIDGQWYFFNARGYMATGWVEWNGKQYYCDLAGGQMLSNTTTPDGVRVGADGAKLP
ncbi:cell wall-binding protein [Lacrimispora indolis]|uniref:cell wall-binding protein n=1 Tax=Lacrimispora indolis TaxID=69825 RepID=UPI000414A057|nr:MULTISPECIES: cell wall-binding protein [Lachnospiraceae]